MGLGLNLLFASPTAHSDGRRRFLGVFDGLAADRALSFLRFCKLFETGEHIVVKLGLALSTTEFDLDSCGFAIAVDFLPLDRANGVDRVTSKRAGKSDSKAAGDDEQRFDHG